MRADRDELTHAFGGAYGRLMALMAAAMKQGHNSEQVRRAARGQGSQVATVYVELRKQRERVDELLGACNLAGVPRADVVKVGREAKAAIEGEFMCRISMVG